MAPVPPATKTFTPARYRPAGAAHPGLTCAPPVESMLRDFRSWGFDVAANATGAVEDHIGSHELARATGYAAPMTKPK